MRQVCALVAAVLVGFSVLATATGPASGDPVPPEVRRATETLKSRVKAWCEIRQDAVYRCPTCGGSGKLRRRQGWSLVIVDCPSCVRGAKVNAEKARIAYYDWATPAWRADKQNVDQTQTWLDSLRAEPAKGLLKKYSIESVELVGLTHGIARVKETHETEQIAPVESRWVLADDPKAKAPVWFVWHESDGDWGVDPVSPSGGASAGMSEPGAMSDPTPPSTSPTPGPVGPKDPPTPAARPVALPPEEVTSLSQVLAVAGLKPEVESVAVDAGTLVVRLKVTGVASQEQLDEEIARSIIPATRAAFRARESERGLRLVFLSRYRDKLGAIEFHPCESVSMDRDLFGKIKFDNLSRDEALDLFTREQHSYRLEGMIPWWKGDPEGAK